MASAYPQFDTISEANESCVEPKNGPNKIQDSESENIRTKAYIPEQLPKDFLRIMLNEQQISETTDEELARRLQFGQQKRHISSGARISPSTFKGRLQIHIVEALLNKNYGFVKMDPYVKMTINNKVYETPTDYSGAKSPKWNKIIMCYIENNIDHIKFEIFDEKSFTDDELIAVVKYPIPESLYTQGFIDEWLPLSGKLGEQKEGSINIRIQFMSINQVHQSERRSHQPAQQLDRFLQSSLEESQALENEEELQLKRTLQLSAAEAGALNVQINEDDFKSVCDMFPSFDGEVIRSLLQANNGNKEITIEKIIEMS